MVLNAAPLPGFLQALMYVGRFVAFLLRGPETGCPMGQKGLTVDLSQ